MSIGLVILILSILGLCIATIFAIMAKNAKELSGTELGCTIASILLYIFSSVSFCGSITAEFHCPEGYKNEIVQNTKSIPVQVTYAQYTPFCGENIQTVILAPMQTKILNNSKVINQKGFEPDGKVIMFDRIGRPLNKYGDSSSF